MENIRDKVEKVFELDISDTTRQLKYIEARACYYQLCIDATAHSLTAIAKSIGKSHGTIIHALKEFPYMMKKNADLKLKYSFIKKEIFGWNTEINNPENLLFNYHKVLIENLALKDDIKELKQIIEQLKKQIK
ncbi:MAG: hypothetical protein Unbinned2072contig1001_3 [Prokaryotic dsDNA virus sp.]|nr:MAG: hypothetical protein Unbinned2072contig1001_3 [Prokaryotic dsDNA virus sp.]|tara:strand:- start:13339 stop:13737 length:399 start_codon:yes stop_codon:yes gene_type:complete